MTATFHWQNDKAVHHLLDVLERVNAETPIANAALVDRASQRRVVGKPRPHEGHGRRLADAERLLFPRRGVSGQRGAEAARLVPPIVSAMNMGLPIGGGTDAHRVMWPSPFVSLQWMVDGRTIGGIAMRAPEEMPSRMQALRLYTEGSAWFSFDDNKRGSLAVGKLADLAVLEQGLPHRADRRDRLHRLAAHHGRRPRGLCGRPVRGL